MTANPDVNKINTNNPSASGFSEGAVCHGKFMCVWERDRIQKLQKSKRPRFWAWWCLGSICMFMFFSCPCGVFSGVLRFSPTSQIYAKWIAYSELPLGVWCPVTDRCPIQAVLPPHSQLSQDSLQIHSWPWPKSVYWKWMKWLQKCWGGVAYLRKGCYEKNQTREMYRFCKFDAFVIHILPWGCTNFCTIL